MKKDLSGDVVNELDNLSTGLTGTKDLLTNSIARYTSLMAKKNFKEALPILEECLVLHPRSVDLRIRHAEYAMQIGDFEAAIARWNWLTENSEKFFISVSWRKLKAYIGNRQFKDAREVLLEIVSRIGESEKTLNFLDIINSKQAKKHKLDIKNNSNDIFGIEVSRNISSINFDNLERFVLKGWVKSSYDNPASIIIKTGGNQSIFKLNEDRLDIKNNFQGKGEDVAIRCGYNYIINASKKVDLGFIVNGNEHWVASIEAAPTLGVIKGVDDWLFLANDSNRSIEQFTGELSLSDTATENWIDFSKKVYSYQKKMDVLYVIANSKEKVFPEFFPFQKAETTVTELVENIFKDNKVNYLNPVLSLRENKNSYYETDTHWSDLGAYIAFEETLRKLGISNPLKDMVKFHDTKAMGDLGSKMQPFQRSIRKIANISGDEQDNLIFFNGIIGRGMIRIYENKTPLINKKVLIFGGSSMKNYTPYLKTIFSRTVEINLAGTFIEEIVEFEKPDILLIQTNERFLINLRPISKSFKESPLFRIISSHEDKDHIIESVGKSDKEVFYKELVLSSFKKTSF